MGRKLRKRCLVEAVEPRLLLTTIYVDNNPAIATHNGAAWASAYASLDQALTAAVAGDSIRVADGTYKQLTNSPFQLKDGVSMFGGYAGFGAANPDQRSPGATPTYLAPRYGYPSFNIVSAVNLLTPVVFDGFSFAFDFGSSYGWGQVEVDGGNLDIRHCSFASNATAVIIKNDASAIISDSVFSGASNLRSDASSVTLQSCTFSNSASASLTNSTVDIADSTFTAGSYAIDADTCTISIAGSLFQDCIDGAISAEDCALDISSSTFAHNGNGSSLSPDDGGAISITRGSLNVSSCQFIANGALYGGAIFDRSFGTISVVNSTFVANRAARGAAIYGVEIGSKLRVANCTFVANRGGSIGVIGGASSGSTITNSIFWDNHATLGTSLTYPYTPTVSYTNVENVAGPTITYVDPLFVRNPSAGPDGVWQTADDDYGDLRLSPASPLIDRGDNTALGAVTTDLAGNPRFLDVPTQPDGGVGSAPIVDLGAYETEPTLDARVLAPEGLVAGTTAAVQAFGASDVPGALQYAWDLDGDGEYDDATGATATLSAIFLDPGAVIRASVRVRDAAFHDAYSSVDVPVVSPYIYVDWSNGSGTIGNGETWATAYRDLRLAVAKAIRGQTIRVGTGSYDLRRSSPFDPLADPPGALKSGVKVEGGYEQIGGSASMSRLVRTGASSYIQLGAFSLSGTDETTVIDGFVFTGDATRLINAAATFRNCIFSGIGSGTSSAAAIQCERSTATLLNCIFGYNNGSVSAIGAYYDSAVRVINCSIVNNSGSISAIRASDNSTVTVVNSILWYNHAAATSSSGGVVSFSYSDVEGGAPGIGNLNVDPQFDLDDYSYPSLLSTSPCLDAGDDAALPNGITTDVAGNRRVYDIPAVGGLGATVDMGAVEYLPFIVSDASFEPATSRPLIGFTLSAPHGFQNTFVGSFAVQNLTTHQPLDVSNAPFVYSSQASIYNLCLPVDLADGNYRFTINPNSITDRHDNFLPGYSFDFFMLRGDANHDRRVDVADFKIFSANYMGSNKTFATGDFNYDGKCDNADLAILSMNWNRYLPAPAPVPADPASLNAALAGTQVNLTWVDQSNNETGFTIERKTGAGGTWAQLAQVGTNVQSYSDTTASAGFTYYYRVCAYNSGGNSGYSNEASAAVPTPVVTTYLSSLNWTAMTNGWGPAEKDRSNGEQGSADGRTITLNGVTYARGIGIHAASDITFALGGNYTQFLSDIGVDDEVGNAGSVIFQVYLDGVLSYTSSTLTGSSATQQVNLNVTGKQTLRLVVTDAGNGATSDHADWANARLMSGGTALPSLPISDPAPPPTSSSSARRKVPSSSAARMVSVVT